MLHLLPSLCVHRGVWLDLRLTFEMPLCEFLLEADDGDDHDSDEEDEAGGGRAHDERDLLLQRSLGCG